MTSNSLENYEQRLLEHLCLVTFRTGSDLRTVLLKKK